MGEIKKKKKEDGGIMMLQDGDYGSLNPKFVFVL